ncbi:MAG: hypothetical protein VCC04_16315 [Myxococcota bacterium]
MIGASVPRLPCAGRGLDPILILPAFEPRYAVLDRVTRELLRQPGAAEV